jgi:hypothetical protein
MPIVWVLLAFVAVKGLGGNGGVKKPKPVDRYAHLRRGGVAKARSAASTDGRAPAGDTLPPASEVFDESLGWATDKLGLGEELGEDAGGKLRAATDWLNQYNPMQIF